MNKEQNFGICPNKQIQQKQQKRSEISLQQKQQ